jgi:hypothetical protein
MTILELDFGPIVRDSVRANLQAFSESFYDAACTGAFDSHGSIDWLGKSSISIDDTADGVEIRLSLPTDSLITLASIKRLFHPQGSLAGHAILKGCELDSEQDTGSTDSRSPWWQKDGRCNWQGIYSHESCLVEIEFESPLVEASRALWQAKLSSLEDVIASAPFLGRESGIYSSIGHTRTIWLSPQRAQYWIEGAGDPEYFLTCLGNLLFNRSGVAPAKSASVLF